jgi:hypothetical protein
MEQLSPLDLKGPVMKELDNPRLRIGGPKESPLPRRVNFAIIPGPPPSIDFAQQLRSLALHFPVVD